MQSETSSRAELLAVLAGGAGRGSSSAAQAVKVEDKAARNGDAKKKEEKTQGKKEGSAPAESAAPAVSAEQVERRFQAIESIAERTEEGVECITVENLRELLTKKAAFRLYDGFEPSGRMHIAQGIFKALNVNKCTSSGGTFVFWVADWFALMNDKMGGDLEKIKVVGQYFIEVWKGAGMDLSKVEFRWASDDIINNAEPYWDQMLDIAKRFTIGRIKKCCQIMGRTENKLTAAQVLYPLMQCTDVFFLKADICQLGLDQRKVNMLAREYCDYIGRKLKPVIVSHHMLFGLAEGQAKMSKSNPDSAIFMEDAVSEVERKLSIAYCPKVPAEGSDKVQNPCLDYVRHIVMTQPGATFSAGGKTFSSADQVETAFFSGALAEGDLKNGLAVCINQLMEPVREHFANDPHAKRVLELVNTYKREAIAPPPSQLKRSKKQAPTPGKTVAVFLPAPSSSATAWPLSTLLGARKALAQAKRVASENGQTVTLYLADLGAVAVNCFANGSKKQRPKDLVNAAYDVIIKALEALGALDGVRVLRQSQVMLADPSDYWISVINVGRLFQLQDVMDALQSGDDGCVGAVIAALMHVGDVLALAPSALVTADESLARAHELAAKYIGMCQTQVDAFPVPKVQTVKAGAGVLSSRAASSSGAALEVLFSDIVEGDGKKAIKKVRQAFCEPGNSSESPLVELASDLFFDVGRGVKVKRTDGQVMEYHSSDSLLKDVSEKLAGSEEFLIHPGDLKQALEPLVAEVFERISKHK